MTVEVRVANASSLREGSCRVVAEAGANHNNSVDRAIEMARKAASAGAWAVKYQLYKADSLTVADSPKYWNDSIDSASQHEAFTLSDRLPYHEYARIAKACRDLGIVFFATPFDLPAVEALESIGVPLYKIASGDLTHRPLLEAVASTGKPILLSTGAAEIEEVRRAMDWIRYGPDLLVLLVCTLTYPTPDEDGNFARIAAFRREFSPYLIGVSDHTLGVAGGWMTGALGGVCIEKHYTLDKGLPDVPDHAMSVDPSELATLVDSCNRATVLRGDQWIGVRPSEEPARRLARRSIVLEHDLPAGAVLSFEHLGFKRPGTGFEPTMASQIVGRSLRTAKARGTVLAEDDLT